MSRVHARMLGAGLIAALAFAAGYWPQHEKYLNALQDLHASDKQMTEAMGSQRIYYLENRIRRLEMCFGCASRHRPSNRVERQFTYSQGKKTHLASVSELGTSQVVIC